MRKRGEEYIIVCPRGGANDKQPPLCVDWGTVLKLRNITEELTILSPSARAFLLCGTHRKAKKINLYDPSVSFVPLLFAIIAP